MAKKKKRKDTAKITFLLVCIFVSLLAAAALWYAVHSMDSPDDPKKPTPDQSSSTITSTSSMFQIADDYKKKKGSLTLESGTEADQMILFESGAEFLGDALVENGLIAGEETEYGLYVTTVMNIEAKKSKRQWWKLTKDGEELQTGVSTTPFEDGANYTFTLSKY